MPASADQARRWLTELTVELRRVPRSPVRIDLARYLYGAIRAHLHGGVELYVALGLRLPKGRPKNRAEHEAAARKIHDLRQAGKSWNEIGETFPHRSDQRELQRIYAEHEYLFLVENTMRRLRLDNTAERRASRLRSWLLQRKSRRAGAVWSLNALDVDPGLSIEALTAKFIKKLITKAAR